MAGLADLFGAQQGPDPTNFLQNLGIALSLMGQGIEGKGNPLQSIVQLQQLKHLRQKDALVQQQGRLAGQVGGMIAGDLRPGEEGPPQPFDWEMAMAMAAQNPDLAKILASPQFIERMRITGRMENPGRLQAETALSTEQTLGGPPKGTFRTREITPQGVSFKDEPPKSLEQIQALNVPKLAQTPQQQMSLVDFTKLDPPTLLAKLNDVQGRVQQLRTQIEGGRNELTGMQIPELQGPGKMAAIADLIMLSHQAQDLSDLYSEKLGIQKRVLYPGLSITQERANEAAKRFAKKNGRAPDPREVLLEIAEEFLGGLGQAGATQP